MKWVKFSEKEPNRDGYYYTAYIHPTYKEVFYKAFWWSTKTKKWSFRFEPEVQAYIPESWNEFYIPCMKSVEESDFRDPYFDHLMRAQ